jgi:ribonuclease HI
VSSKIQIFTDGACSGNPGPGGYGLVMISGSHRKEISGSARQTTNNRMEMLAAIRALEVLNQPSQVALTTDSQYLKQGITQWVHGWIRNGWMTSAKKPVKNEDLWRRLLDAVDRHEVTWLWVKGHAGHPENECADRLAVLGTARGKVGTEDEQVMVPM